VRAAGGAARGDGAKTPRKDVPTGKLWVLDDAGQPKLVRVRTGLSDGSITEILGDEITEGTQVIVAQLSAAARQGAGSTNPFAPAPFRR
jgi:HlyD family secretion protein